MHIPLQRTIGKSAKLALQIALVPLPLWLRAGMLAILVFGEKRLVSPPRHLNRLKPLFHTTEGTEARAQTAEEVAVWGSEVPEKREGG